MKGILKWPLVIAAIVVVARVVTEQSGVPDTINNLISVVGLHFLIVPLYIAVRIAKSGTPHPYATLFKLIAIYVVLTRAMIIPVYWLARIYEWPQQRFYGTWGPEVSPLVGVIGVPFLTAAFWIVASLVFGGALGSLVVGTLLAAMRVSPVPVLRSAGGLYVTMLRNTPLTLVIFFSFFALGANLGLQFSGTLTTNAFWLAVIGLVAYTSAFVCEAIRSGINTVPVGQAEAARSIGLTFAQSLRIVVLPQAFRSVVAPLGSVFIALTKNTTIAATIGVGEAAGVMRDLIESESEVFAIFAGVAVGFVVLTLPVGLLFGSVARRVAVQR